MTFHVPEKYRVTTGQWRTRASTHGNNGLFLIPHRIPGGAQMTVIASDGEGWEHVSASFPNRCPSWEEMCRVKALFWDDEDCVMQLHPPKSEWISNHKYCLHLWRPVGVEIPRPPGFMVGVKELVELA